MAKVQVEKKPNAHGRMINHIYHEETEMWISVGEFAKKHGNINLPATTIKTRIVNGCEYADLLKPSTNSSTNGTKNNRKRMKEGRPTFATGFAD